MKYELLQIHETQYDLLENNRSAALRTTLIATMLGDESSTASSKAATFVSQLKSNRYLGNDMQVYPQYTVTIVPYR